MKNQVTGRFGQGAAVRLHDVPWFGLLSIVLGLALEFLPLIPGRGLSPKALVWMLGVTWMIIGNQTLNFVSIRATNILLSARITVLESKLAALRKQKT